MKYSVAWLSSAERELTTLWLDAADRNAISRAAHAIDRQLQQDAHLKGESRHGGRRILNELPLVVSFRADPTAAVVLVSQVWAARKPRK
ncbi:MAG: hypothetical protein JNM56_09735 [Planctomycetia bacterium]|nr:hypothetical protein [Planctomycetia bacterium]